ncbi:MAG: hypothetical protein ACYS0K_13915 [Planctomycetota bacterium]
MKKGLGMLLALAAVTLAGGGLGGKITGGRPKKLVDKGLPLIKQADAIWNAWILDEIENKDLTAKLKQAIKLYDEGTSLLHQAVEIQNDAGVNHRLNIAARRLQKIRFYVSFRLEKRRRPLPQPPPTKPGEEPAPRPTEPVGPPPRPSREELEDETSPAVSFLAGQPPAALSAADLPRFADMPEVNKAHISAIKERIRDYFDAFRRNKILHRHRLCRGKGTFSNGAPCEECHGTGHEINLHFFRKAFWTSYAPTLRDAEGALGALAVFYDRAQKDNSVLGPVVTSFKITDVDYQGYWAKAKVDANTKAGKKEYAISLISIGSSWFFFNSATDGALLPKEMQ